MSYCRFAWDGSEVYVYEAEEGFTCCGCHLEKDKDKIGWFVCATEEEMIAHLAAHRRADQYVPEYAITGLWNEIEGRTQRKEAEPLVMLRANIIMEIAMLNNLLEDLTKKAEEQDRKNEHDQD